eukprot:CAMPEP_0185767900 /NCGR_PEP_ID=MMETSP1174-20130828/45683_1 /TAXON_ID=35687 /ORGANISM="Dictyocha speculum, Strain CCMP1381" /LENGTH=363 /DNA_ID=CAMNT_0028452283 /DNA_START=20 /DNA_END=1111 /DNA_ORIENTATION=-
MMMLKLILSGLFTLTSVQSRHSPPANRRVGLPSLFHRDPLRQYIASRTPYGPSAAVLSVRGGSSEEEFEDSDVVDEIEVEETSDGPETVASKPLKLGEGPLDKLLHITKTYGRVIERHHTALATDSPLAFLCKNPMFVQFGLVMVLLQISKYVDFVNPAHAKIIKAWYTGAQLVMIFVHLMIRQSILAEDDQTLVTQTMNPLAEKLISSATGDSESTAGSIASVISQKLSKETTAKEYDMKLVKQMMRAQFFPMVFMYVLTSFKPDTTKVIMYAPISSLVQLFSDKLFQIHILGREATEALARPFAPPSNDMMEKMKEKMEAERAAAITSEDEDEELEIIEGEVSEVESEDEGGATDEGNLDE